MGRIYSHLKVFQYPEKLHSLPPAESTVLAPLNIRIKPTNVCNHDCWYCAYRVDNLQLGKDMVERDRIPRDKMMEILDDLIDMKVQAVTFSGGGEPFVYPYFLETVKKLAQSDIKFASLTNGSRLKGEVAEIFAERGTWIRVSLDGWDAESYAKIRRVDLDEHAKVLANMEAFQKLGGRCYLSVVINVGQDNAPHVYEMVSALAGIGVNSVKVAPVISSNDADETNKYHEPHYNLVRSQIDRAKQDFAGPQFELYDSYHRQLESFSKDYTWCPNIQITPVIGADLNVYACQDKAYNLEEGLIFSIKDQRFKDGWFANKDQFLKVNPRKCCNHHCVAHSKNTAILELLELDPFHQMFV